MKLRGIEKKNKRGQEITLGTIILIVLGIAVLVFLIWGFSAGWSNFWGKISAMFGGGSNVDSIKLACNLDCQQQNAQAFCIATKTLKYSDASGNIQKVSVSCDGIRNGELKGVVNIDDCSEISVEDCSNALSALPTTTTKSPAPASLP
jgi:hypothetical protein